MGTEEQTRHADVISVTKLLMHDMRLTTIAQARLDPWMEEGCWTIGPIPCALRTHHTRNTIAAMGVSTVFTTKKWRLLRRRESESRTEHLLLRTSCAQETITMAAIGARTRRST